MNNDRPPHVVAHICALNRELATLEKRIARAPRTTPGQQPSERRIANRLAARERISRRLAVMI